MARFFKLTAKAMFVVVAGYLLWRWSLSRRTGTDRGGEPPRRSGERPAQIHIPSQIIPPGGPDISPIAANWVEPVGEECPVSHPVKATLANQVFYVVGDVAYHHVVPERCYIDTDAAEADGFGRVQS